MSALDILKIHRYVSNVCPIVGLSGNPAQPATLRIDFDPIATEQQKQEAMALLQNLNPSSLIAPDPDAMLTAIWDDPIWQAAPEARPLRPQLAAMKDVLKTYLERGETNRVYEAWADMKLGIPAPIAALVEGYAAAFNVPLVPPQ